MRRCGFLLVALLLLPVVARLPAQAQGGGVYFGNLHSHTSYSDGTDTPRNAYAKARAAGLDFLAITEHNHRDCERGAADRADGVMIARKPELYGFLINAALQATENGGFVGLYGQEFSSISKGNHVNVFEVGAVIPDGVVPNGAYRLLYTDWLPAHPDSTGAPPILQLNHPDLAADLRPPSGNTTRDADRENDYGYGEYGRSFPSLREATAPFVRLIEVLSGPAMTTAFVPRLPAHSVHESDYLSYLAQGFRIAPTGNQDNHHFSALGSSSNARTGVHAPELTRRAILDALRARRCYATEDADLEVEFTLQGQPMGSVVALEPQPLQIHVRLRDPSEGAAPYLVELLQGEASGVRATPIDRRQRTGDGEVVFDGYQFTGQPVYYLVKVIQSTGAQRDRAWTAPVWLDAAAPAPPPAPRFAWSERSGIYHVSTCSVVAQISPANLRTADTAPAGRTLHQGCPR